MLIPSEKCPNINKQTYFFKPVYQKNETKYIKFQKKYIKIKPLLDKSKSTPNFFSEEHNLAREIILGKLGVKLNKNMSLYDLYLTPYYANDTFKYGINQFVVDKYQKINRFFNFEEYVSKSFTYINYKVFKNKFPSDYNYTEEKNLIEKKFSNYTIKNNKEIWMIKPKLKNQGLNISLLTNFSDIILDNYILTKSLYKPHLIKGYKYDMRFHGLVSSVQPLILYLYNEGMVRFSSEKYNFSESNLKNKFMFLTNININNQNSDKYKNPTNAANIENSNL